MALERHNLREDLVAVIAAGRELSREHDYALADMFLANLHPIKAAEPTLGDLLRKHSAALIGAAVLSLATLMFLLFAAMGHDGNGGDGGPYFDRSVFNDQSPWDGNTPPWWHDTNQAPNTQFPVFPTQPNIPNT